MNKKIINAMFGVGLLSLSLILFSCGNGNNDNTTTIPTTVAPVTTTSTTPTASSTVVTTTTTIDGYKVVFDTDGGSNVDTEIVEKNGKVIKPTDPIRGDNVFLGWCNEDIIK